MKQPKHNISRASLLAGIHPNTAKNYCREGVVTPERLSSGMRIFTDADVEAMRARRAANTRHKPKAPA